MTERERWIVYPLLFLALGASLRDKFSSHTSSRVIECEELRVVDESTNGREHQRVLATLGRSETSSALRSQGELKVNGQVMILDADDLGMDIPSRPVAQLGRLPAIDQSPATGFLMIDGIAKIDRQLILQGVQISPVNTIWRGLRQMLPGLQPTTPPQTAPPIQNQESSPPDGGMG